MALVLRHREIGARLGGDGLVGARIDHHQDVAGLDGLAVPEAEVGDAAADFGPDVGGG
ncbi:MAG: hypothetical protein WDN03_06545 [Rhizomicrobium sp.]